MIDLEHAQPLLRMGIAQRKSVESRAQHNRLAQAACDGLGQRRLGKAAARRDEKPQRPQAPVPRALISLGAAFRAENFAREGVVKDASPLETLMRGAMSCGAARGKARPIVLHGCRNKFWI
ncbi:hypothetical protein DSM21852_08690 [Methylocystis bryophila]|nr:hypothetical protein DSM21852_08690 [Methylocystis bryophila]